MEKLKILNNLQVIEHQASGGELECVYIEDNDHNREMLRLLGVPEQEVDDMKSDDLIDISYFGFSYGGAKWFEPDIDPSGAWLDYIPDHAPEWAK